MGAIEGMADLVGRYGGGGDARGNVHTLAGDIRVGSLEALLPGDLEKHVQLNRAGLDVKKSETYCEGTGHARARSTGPSHPGRDDPMDSGAFSNGKGKHGKGKGKGQQGRQGQQDKNKDMDKEQRFVGARRTRPRKVVLMERTQRTLTILTLRNQQTVN